MSKFSPLPFLCRFVAPAEDTYFHVSDGVIGQIKVSGYREVFAVFGNRALVIVKSSAELGACLANVGDPGTFGTHYAVEHVTCVTCVVRGANGIGLGNLHFAISGDMLADLASWLAAFFVSFRGRVFGQITTDKEPSQVRRLALGMKWRFAHRM